MKVLRYGPDSDLPTYKVCCNGTGCYNEGKPCFSELEINPFDVQKGQYVDMAGDKEGYYYIVCPVCGIKTEVYKGNMPQDFKRMLNCILSH